MKSLKILLLVTLSVYISCVDKTDILKSLINQPKQLFKTYYTLFEKSNEYDINSVEGVRRFGIFQKNVKRIQSLNQELGKETYGFTPFVDMTQGEFQEKYLMNPHTLERLMSQHVIEAKEEKNEKVDKFLNEVPDFSYLEKLGKIKDQGGCGSCWAFAAIAVIESRYMQLSGTYREFSEQHLVDCDNYDNGCNGGWPTGTLKWMFENGVQDRNLRPYEGQEKSCDLLVEKSKSLWIVKDIISKDYQNLGADRKDLFLNDLKEKGPFIVVMDASTPDLSLYRPTSLDFPLPGNNCKNINHAVTAIGKKGDLIYVRNSWGVGWGYQGNFSVTKDSDCFITSYGFGAVLGANSNPGTFDNKIPDIPDDDPYDDNDNQQCGETFFIDCNFIKQRKLKNCDYFTNADEHLGPGNEIKGINSSTRYWTFYNQPHCVGPATNYYNKSTSNMCFSWFTAPYVNLKSGHAMDSTMSVQPNQALLSNDYCFGGRRILISGDQKKSSWGEEFVPKSIAFPAWSGSNIVRGVLLFEEENFKGNSCYLKKEPTEGPLFGNVNCGIFRVRSVLTVKSYPSIN